MQKIYVKVRTAENEIKNVSIIVASTKSKNIAYKKLEEQNVNVFQTSEKVENFYIDRETAKAKAQEMSATIKNLSEEEQKQLCSEILSALEIGCLVKKNKPSK